MASTKSIGDSFDANGVYAQSFGVIPNNTTYSDPQGLKGISGIDFRKKLSEAYDVGLKAHTSQAGGAGTAGYGMIPVYIDNRIIDMTRKSTPLVELVPRVTNQGMYADWNMVTGKGGGFTASEGASLSETTTTYDRYSKSIKFLYAVGAVTGPAIAGQPSYILAGMNPNGGAVSSFADQGAGNALQTEVLIKTRELRELEENLIINGNATTSGIAGNPNGTEFDGIITQMGSTNTVDKNTADLALSDINTAIQYAFDDGGRPNLAVCSSGVYNDLLNLLNAKIGYMQSVKEVFWGFSTIVLNTMVGQIPVIPSMFMSNTSGSKAIYFLDMTVVEMRVLQDIMYQELAQTNDSRKFMLKVYETFLIKNPSFCSSVTEIKA